MKPGFGSKSKKKKQKKKSKQGKHKAEADATMRDAAAASAPAPTPERQLGPPAAATDAAAEPAAAGEGLLTAKARQKGRMQLKKALKVQVACLKGKRCVR
jgi:hypothetical protein